MQLTKIVTLVEVRSPDWKPGKRLKNSNADDFSDSPADDSDRDPDYEPEKKRRKYTPRYFMNSGDTSDSHREPVHGSITKELRLIDYKEGSEVFPNMPIWESQGLSVDEMQTAIETSNPLLFGQKQTPTNASEDKMYFQLEAIDNNHPIVQPSISEINSYVPNPVQNGSNTDGMMSILTETIEKTQNDDQDFFLEEQSEISQSPIEHHILNSEEIDDIPQVAAPEQVSRNSLGKNPKKRSSDKSAPTEKLKLLPPCQNNCRQKCFERLSSEQRNTIFDYFRKLDFGQRQLFLHKYIIKKPVKYRKVDAERNKNYSIIYNLPVIRKSSSVTTQEDQQHFVGNNIAFISTSEQNESVIISDEILTEPNELLDKTNGVSAKPNEKHTDIKVNEHEHNMVPVCKPMFIHTIGFKSDGLITNFLKRTSNDLPCLEDRRGKVNAVKMKEIGEQNYNTVKKHIESFHPQVSHYKTEHAPNRRYLPCDITIHQMYRDFISKYKNLSYETYRKIFDRENIGFSSPSQDDCSVCSVFKQHSHPEKSTEPEIPSNDHNIISPTPPEIPTKMPSSSEIIEPDETCSICDKFQIHKRRYTIARQKYNEDATKKWDHDQELYTADMQKVLILPKMTIKNAFFVSRLVVFHETFANLKVGGRNKCVLWHEAIRGRNGPDVVSAYYNALIRLDDETKHVTFWTDNCTAQNKNWVLFTACIIFVNEDWGPESITFKYFEPGHSFMKADSIHGQIGKKWKRTPEVLDYEDLERLIKSSNKLNTIISLRAEDFKVFASGCTQRNKGSPIPKLGDIKSVQFRKGSRKMFFKQELEDDEFSEASILKPKFKLELPETVRSDRGINTKKKDIIVRDLLPHMPPRKQIFWMNLPSSDDLEDLGEHIE